MAELIVLEDDPVTRRALSLVASQLGHNVRSFGEPRSAIRAIAAKHPDVLVTDWDLDSVVSGISVALHALAASPASQVILITGNNMSQLKRQTQTVNNVHYMAKPFDLHTVRQAIDDATRKSLR